MTLFLMDVEQVAYRQRVLEERKLNLSSPNKGK
jgi:hypothetical protein